MGLFSYFTTRRNKKFLQKMDIAIDQVKHGTYNFLFVRYLERFERDFAGALAAAVTNALFNAKPAGKTAEDFLAANRDAVQTELLALKGDNSIGFLVADAIQNKAMLIFGNQKSGTRDHDFGKAYENLIKLDFLKKKEDVTPPKLFMIKAEKYFSKSLKTVKYK
jgi:hypothetical protein